MELKSMEYNATKVTDLRYAIQEAERFIKRAKVAIKAANEGYDTWYQNQYIAAAKRASMDLTRALVFVRKSVYDRNSQDKHL